MTEKTMAVGLASHEELKRRAVAIARGDRKRAPEEPKVWFVSLDSMARVLSDDNRHLLKVIADEQPGSIAELSALTGRKANNLSRTLKTMERIGLVHLERGAHRRLVPRLTAERLVLDLPLT